MVTFSFVLAILSCFVVQVFSIKFIPKQELKLIPPGPGDCETITGEKCKFPFVYRAKTYYECTYDDTNDGKPWCPYELRQDGSAVPGKNENCDTSVCYISEPDPCITVSGPDAGNSCKFPFKYNGKTHNSCTKYTWSGQNHGKSWCSTQTDRYGNHENGKGKYGFCDSSCPGWRPTPRTTPTPTTSECTTLSRSGPVRNTKCVFPFKYNGITHHCCTKYTSSGPDYVRGSPDYGKYWCSTNTDRNGDFIPGNYGFCGIGNGCF